jgi:ubiquinone/menaquinone biosynthesis C-methylase UbiE
VGHSGTDYFEAIGAGWDRLRESFYSTRVREAALAAAGVEPGRDAADLGAGTGFMTRGLLGRGVRVVAVDRSPAMLAALQRKFAWCEEVRCRVGDAEQLPIAEESVDYCFANMVLHHVERPSLAIAEMARILRPGGRAVVTDLDAHELALLREEHHDRWMGFRRQDVRRWFRAAGFAQVRVDCLGEKCCAATANGEDAAVGIFIASATKPETAASDRRNRRTSCTT